MRRYATGVDTSVTLRPFAEGDLEACQHIATAAPDFAHVVDANADAMEVALLGDRVVGYAYIQVWPWNGVAWLGDVLVEPDVRGRGIGPALVERMETRARELGARVLMDHPPAGHPAVNFYLTLGFRICGYNDRFYSQGEGATAIFVSKDL
jgi:GNAT superfamily N-acetyltransferase